MGGEDLGLAGRSCPGAEGAHRHGIQAPMKLSSSEARAIAVTAQGLAEPRPPRVDLKAVRALVQRLGVLQLDSVNVLVRSHYLPIFSRLGLYDASLLDKLAYSGERALFEYWGHMASLLPVELQPLFRWRMAFAEKHSWAGIRRVARYQKALVQDVLETVASKGPLGAGELELGKPKRKGWWEWSDAKRAVEYLFWSGQVTTGGRRSFERLYDLPERVLPKRILETPTPDPLEARRDLMERSARRLGVATEGDLRDYYRLKPEMSRAALATLLEQGVVQQVTVQGWEKPAYLHRDAKALPIDVDRAALLSPFDNLIWARERTERLFGMKFRLEIYTPQHKRVHGYFVLPFLLGDKLVARVDLKSDREAGALLVQDMHLEPGMVKSRVSKALNEELALLARWLKLDRVVQKKG
jgi:uncharacterized protein YcaQ